MPKSLSRKKSSSFDVGANGSGSQDLIRGENNNFKKIGALIIGLGIILIIALVFLAYRYIINPKPKTSSPVPSAPVTEDKKVESEDLNILETDIEEPDLETNTSTEIRVDDEVISIDGDNEQDLINEDDALSDEKDIIIPFRLLDTDGDLLYDEEEIILGTDIDNEDTDGDGYSDMEEIKNNYNPVGLGDLKDNPALGTYNSPVANYSILYPLAWNISTSNNDYTLIITAEDSSIMQVTVQPNIKMQNILAWYAENVSPGVVDTSKVQNNSTWEGIVSEDGRYFYLTDAEKSHIYAISYEPVISGQVAYPNIFKMIINSLVIY